MALLFPVIKRKTDPIKTAVKHWFLTSDTDLFIRSLSCIATCWQLLGMKKAGYLEISNDSPKRTGYPELCSDRMIHRENLTWNKTASIALSNAASDDEL